MFKFSKITVISFLILIASCKEQTVQKQETEASKEIQYKHFSLPSIPEFIMFCGEKIMLKDHDLRERLDREIMVNTYYHSSTNMYFKRQSRYFPTIEKILKENNLPDDLKYVALIESGLAQATSPAGARGLWQFMEATGKEFDLVINKEIDERYNYVKSSYAACAYLKNARDSVNSWVEAVAAYNRGLAGLKSDMKRQGVQSYFDCDMNSETGRYIFRVLALKLIFENPNAYNFFPEDLELYEPYNTKEFIVNSTISDLSQWAIENGINYKILTILNPWIISNSLTVKNNSYTILLPIESENLKPYRKY